MQRPASAIFDRFTGRAKPALVHPTAKKFDAEALMRSLDPDAITGPDLELLAAAVFFGGQIQTLRQHVLSTVFSQMGQRDVLRLAIAAANRAVILTKAAMYAEAKKRARTAEAGHLAAVAEATVSTQQGAMAANAVSTAAIDALPHWFALAADRPETPGEAADDKTFDYARLHARAEQAVTIERSLRDLWQQCLWEGWTLDPVGLTHRPRNRDEAALWRTWQHRQDALMAQYSHFDALIGQKHEDKPPSVTRAVASAEFRGGRMKVSMRSPNVRQCAEHYLLMEMAHESYLGPFLKTPVPSESFTVEALLKSWLILKTLADALTRGCGVAEMSDRTDLKRLSFEMPAVRVHEALSRGLGVDTAEAERMARYFTAEPLALSDMFGAGLWHRPIIQLPGRSGVLIATAVLQSANLIYVLERLFKATRLDAALEKGSLGLAYEDRVRSKFGQALSRNQTLSDARVAPTAITRKAPDDEEIDLVLRVETLIIVGEIKCFVRPTDPIDRFTYLEKLKAAAEQAQRKRDWLKERPAILRSALNEPALSPEGLCFVPLVVLNNGAGVGLKIGDTLITDAHWLELMLHSERYGSGAIRDNRIGRFTTKFTTAYKTAAEFVAGFERLMTEMPSLSKFKSALVWESFNFPTADGKMLKIDHANLSSDLLALAESRN